MRYTKTGFIIFILFLSMVIPVTIAIDQQAEEIADEGYILDQIQTNDGFYYGIIQGTPAAQRFKPTITPLAKVRLLIRFEGDVIVSPSEQIQVSIREVLDGPDLTSVRVQATEIGTEESWVNFDFDDITINPDDTYFIVLQSFYVLELTN